MDIIAELVKERCKYLILSEKKEVWYKRIQIRWRNWQMMRAYARQLRAFCDKNVIKFTLTSDGIRVIRR